jgi:hypothetical protein
VDIQAVADIPEVGAAILAAEVREAVSDIQAAEVILAALEAPEAEAILVRTSIHEADREAAAKLGRSSSRPRFVGRVRYRFTRLCPVRMATRAQRSPLPTRIHRPSST